MISAIAVIRALAIYRVPKKTFLALWGVALVRLLIPFSLPSGLSIYSLLKRETPALAGGAAAVRLLPPAVSPGQAAPRPIAAPAAAVSVWEILWAAGLILCAAFFAASYWRCYREFQTSLPVKNDFCRRWLRAHPLRRTVSIRQSDRVSSPLTFGTLRPVILLPRKTDWENEHALQYVLEHELVHIRRFDTVSKLLLIAAVCVHWFNPLVWAAAYMSRTDGELAILESILGKLKAAIQAGDILSIFEYDRAFHDDLARAAHNPILFACLQTIEEINEACVKRYDKFLIMLDDCYNEHFQIFTAVANQQPEKAQAAMAQHARSSKKILL